MSVWGSFMSASNVTPLRLNKPFNVGIDFDTYPFPRFDKDGHAIGAIAHVDNLTHLMSLYGISVRYNLITKDQEIALPDSNSSLMDNAKGQRLEAIKSLCEINRFPIGRIQEQLVAIANANPYNPIIEYCTQKEWDQKDRIKAVVDTVVTDIEINKWKEAAIVKFMIAAVCAAINDEYKKFKFKSILTFQGIQGLGKTPFIKILMGDMNKYLLQGHILNPENKDSKIAALKHWIVELGEVDATTRKADVAALKGFVDQFTDDIRLPYAAEISTWTRRTVFFATVNPSSFLVDNTGNDRYWSIPVLELKLNELEKIDMQQLWAQVYEMAINELSLGIREPWKLTDDERLQQQRINEAFRLMTPIEDAITEAFEGLENEPSMWQASLLDICEALGWNKSKLSPKDKQAAKILIEKMFSSNTYQGKRGFSIPNIRGTFENELIAIGMKRRAGR